MQAFVRFIAPLACLAAGLSPASCPDDGQGCPAPAARRGQSLLQVGQKSGSLGVDEDEGVPDPVVKKTIEELMANAMKKDFTAEQDLLNASSNTTSSNASEDGGPGFISMAATVEFMHIKMAQLETAFGIMLARFDALEKEVVACNARVESLENATGHGGDSLLQEAARRQAEGEALQERRRQRQEDEGKRSVEVLRATIGKHQAQVARLRAGAEGQELREGAEAGQREQQSQKAAAQAQGEKWDWINDAIDTVGEGVKDAGEAIVDLGGDTVEALGDAYEKAVDKTAFVAETVIDTVEKAYEVLSRGFDISAPSCSSNFNPGVSIDDTKLAMWLGTQRCTAKLVGQEFTLIDISISRRTFPLPQTLQAAIQLGKGIEGCMSNTQGVSLFECMAKEVGEAMVKVLPPFSSFNQLSDVISQFVTYFATMASSVVRQALGDTFSLVEQAASAKFPDAGEAPALFQSGKHLVVTAHRRSLPGRRAERAGVSLEQEGRAAANATSKDGSPTGGLKFSVGSAPLYQSRLITQFGGVETNTGSCVAFRPSSVRRRRVQVKKEDWQTSSSDQKFELTAVAVPCTNQWLKDNPEKWEGFATYFMEKSLEKCVTVAFSLSVQPTAAFIGGITWDIVPAPIAEVESQVCWPDTQPGGQDLSMVSTVIKTAGIPILKKVVRLSKRYGNGTDFTTPNTKSIVTSARRSFGFPEDPGNNGSYMDTISRESLLQQERRPVYEVDQSELLVATAVYDEKLGVTITSNLTGAAAGRHLRDLARAKRLEAVQSGAGKAAAGKSAASGSVVPLFTMENPASNIVNFKVVGQMNGNTLEMINKLAFGPFESPEVPIEVFDIMDQLRLVLSALPLVSTASKESALATFADFDINSMSDGPRHYIVWGRLSNSDGTDSRCWDNEKTYDARPWNLGIGCCTSSGVGSRPGCKQALTYAAAVEYCEARGLRLCTKDELLAGATSGTGCQFDHRMSWTSTEC